MFATTVLDTGLGEQLPFNPRWERLEGQMDGFHDELERLSPPSLLESHHRKSLQIVENLEGIASISFRIASLNNLYALDSHMEDTLNGLNRNVSSARGLENRFGISIWSEIDSLDRENWDYDLMTDN